MLTIFAFQGTSRAKSSAMTTFSSTCCLQLSPDQPRSCVSPAEVAVTVVLFKDKRYNICTLYPSPFCSHIVGMFYFHLDLLFFLKK